MKARINGESIDISRQMSIKEFLESRTINPKAVVVEYNRRILQPREWDGIFLKENDSLEIVSFVGGG